MLLLLSLTTSPPAAQQTSAGTPGEFIDGFEFFCPPPIVPDRDTSLTHYSDLYGAVWPGPNFDPINIAVDSFEYMALAFSVPDIPLDGAISTIQASVPNTAALLVSIDRCPGVLSTREELCSDGVPSIKTFINWSHLSDQSPSRCLLQEGQTYYLNIFFGDASGNNTCMFSECVTRFDNRY